MGRSLGVGENLSITAEAIEGIVLIRVRYKHELALRSGLLEEFESRILNAFKENRDRRTANPSCGVVVEADAEFDDLTLIRSILALWNEISRLDGRVFCVGYPRLTGNGDPVPMPPLMPGLAFSRDIESGIAWVRRPPELMEGGDNWNSEPGTSRGRSLIPGERFLEDGPEGLLLSRTWLRALGLWFERVRTFVRGR